MMHKLNLLRQTAHGMKFQPQLAEIAEATSHRSLSYINEGL